MPSDLPSSQGQNQFQPSKFTFADLGFIKNFIEYLMQLSLTRI